MNKNIKKPLIIQFTPPEEQPIMKRSPKSVFVPVNTTWTQFRDNVLPLVADQTYDSVLVHAKDDVDRDRKGVVGNMAIKMNALAGAGTKAGKPVLSYESIDKPFYLANPTRADMKEASLYAPSDETIMERYNSYGSDVAWQEHQGRIWERMKDMMPLSKSTDQFNRNHAAQLKDPKRGLEEKDLGKFWSFKSRQGLSPTVMGDDMLGMPSVEGREYDGFTISINQPNGTVAIRPLQVRSLMTCGPTGIAIPMANADGHVSKHQIATDLTAYGTVLHFRAADGKTVSKGELFDKKTREYAFHFTDGSPTNLKVTDVSSDNVITMQDTRGIFNVKPKEEIIDVLKERGYTVPDIITSVKPEQNGKYMWQAPGTMTGSENVLKTVSPSNPGFIKAREPKNGEDEYVVLVAEGALKGQIVAKYIDVKDKNGKCFGDKIAGDKGIIVAQVPGVAEAYVKNVLPIYEKYNVEGTYIAMDADGRENRNVAMGIHSAHRYLSNVKPATVLSWNPEQKGLDDALLAVAQKKITIEEMGLVHGMPDRLFPMENTKQMTPYKLDGTQTSTPTWMQEYTEDNNARREKMAAAQMATAEREKKLDTAFGNAPAEAQKESQAETAKEEPKTGQWVKTPEDISNIQSITVSKAADMADAMAGTLPPAKSDPKVVHTPDVDEIVAENVEKEEYGEGRTMPVQKTDKQGQDEAAVEEALRKWDARNRAMPPLDVPEGYRSTYTYMQPIKLVPGQALNLPEDMPYTGGYMEKWGHVSLESDHELSDEEIQGRQDQLKENGVICAGDMRLTGQSFTLDPGSLSVELTAEDLDLKSPGDGIKI